MDLTLTDLFVAGLAFDVSGAILPGRGLLASPALIGVLSTSYWDWNAGDARLRGLGVADASDERNALPRGPGAHRCAGPSKPRASDLLRRDGRGMSVACRGRRARRRGGRRG